MIWSLSISLNVTVDVEKESFEEEIVWNQILAHSKMHSKQILYNLFVKQSYI